jgi:putative membrane protein
VIRMRKLSEAERNAVVVAIREAEQGTSAEFVAVVARRIDRHHGVSFTLGLAAALLAGIAVASLDPWASVWKALAAQCIAFAVVYLIADFTPLAARLAPRPVRAAKARRLAHLLFLDRGLAGLPAHNGVLLLVALAEQQVEIVADHAIERLAGGEAWSGVVRSFATGARTGEVGAALVAALMELGAIMARHFPPEAGQASRVPDRLIEL